MPMPHTANKNQRAVALWLWSGAGLILLMTIIGGITRLTGSGLSMTDWNLVLGIIPPTDSAGWMNAFEQYKQFPEYQQLTSGMTLSEFKEIYSWEYLHRLTGRLTGMVFLVPFLWFWYRGYFDRAQITRLSVLFLLGATQGAMGWVMVKSGLVDLPYVSHYRLALHLVLSFLLFGFCVWLALDLNERRGAKENIREENAAGFFSWMYGIAGVLLLQVVWGAFVAGLKAGYIYNTFPLMNESLMPVNAWAMEPLLLNLFENPGVVQWSHRVIGTVLVLTVILFWIRVATYNIHRAVQYRVFALMVLVFVQFLLGVFTLVTHVPIALAVAHQVMALMIWGSWIELYHRLKRKRKKIYL